MGNLNSTDEDGKSIVDLARQRFQLAKDALDRSRIQSVEDTRFVMGDSDNGWQWPEQVRLLREGSQRVVLTVNVTAQHCNQIINQIRQNRPSAKVLPVDSGADVKTAELLGGLLRQIQSHSRADDAHDIAAEHAIYGGEGYWRVLTEYESPKSFKQRIRVAAITDPTMVYVDPHTQTPDKSDAEWGFVVEDITKEQCKRDHPGVDPTSWVQDGQSGWVTTDTIRRAEYFWCEYVKDEALLLADGQEILRSDLQGQELPPEMIVDKRDTFRKQWWWAKLLGGETEPLDKKEWPGSYLPIISCIGKEINVKGQIVRKGIVRDLKDPARMVNYSYSAAVESVALQNDVPYIAAAESIKGYETEWGQANRTTAAYLPFNAYDDDDRQLPPPQRQQPAIMPAAQVQMLELSVEQMRAASGQQNANFGIRSDAQSGIGIQRLKQQGEVATFHFPDNLSRALRYEARVILDLVPKIYDTKRVIRVLGLDGDVDVATLDPEQQQAYGEKMNALAKDAEKIFNPNVGEYDVVIDTGPSYATQRQEAFQAMTELASQRPELLQIAGDIIMRAADFPMAQELAERLKKTIPPQLLEDEGKNHQIPPQVQAQLEQMQQQMEQMKQMLDAADQEVGRLQGVEQDKTAQTLKVQTDAQLGSHELEIKAQQLEIDRYEAETRRMQVQAQMMQQAQQAMEPDEPAEEVDENGQAMPKDTDVILQAITGLAAALAADEQAEAATLQSIAEQQQAIQQAIESLTAIQSAPKEVVVSRDEQGNLRGRVVPTLQ